MSKPEEISRNYNCSDPDMIQASGVMRGFFLEDKNSFISFDSVFNDPFADNWLAKIDEASHVPHDAMFIDLQAEFTKKVELKMEEANNLFQKQKYFIEKAFPKQNTVWNQFGFNDIKKARQSTAQMIKFLSMLYSASLQYKPQIIAAGFTNEMIEQINTLQHELTAAENEQETMKKRRPMLTQERIIRLNACFEFMKKVSKAAKLIFENNAAKYDLYLLPAETKRKTEDKIETADESEKSNGLNSN